MICELARRNVSQHALSGKTSVDHICGFLGNDDLLCALSAGAFDLNVFNDLNRRRRIGVLFR
jgi:hypothetical protein